MTKRNLSFIGFVLTIFCSALITSCGEEKITAKSSQPASLSYHEEFDSMQRVINMGWKGVNLSDPLGGDSWQQGSYIVNTQKGGPFVSSIASHSYKASANEHAFVPYTCGAGLSFINCWLISPELSMKNGDKITFWTTTANPVSFPDRMQVWLNPTNNSTNVGRGPNETGDFSVLLKGSSNGSAEQPLDLNPGLSAIPFDSNNFAGSGYPTTWTKFEITLTGLPNGTIPQKHRVAFRYYVKNGGPSGFVSDQIAIDDFDFISQ
jgi:hypothetical protein